MKILKSFLPPFLKKYFEQYQKLESILENVLWLFMIKVFITISNVVVGAFVARYLGPENIGIINYALAFISIFAIFSSLGLDSLIVMEIRKNEDNKESILGTSFIIRLFSGLITFIVCTVFAFLFNDNVSTVIIIIIYSLSFILSSVGVINFYFEAKLLNKITSRLGLFNSILGSIINLGLVILKAPLIYFVLSNLFNSLTGLLFLVFLYVSRGNSFKYWKLDKEIAKNFIKNGFALTFSSIIFTLWNKVDILMIKYFLNELEVGIYSIAVSINDYFMFFPSIINTVIFPILVEKRKENLKSYHSYLLKVSEFFLAMAILIVVVMLITGKYIILFLYGYKFEQSASVLSIIVFTNVIRFIAIVGFDWILIEDLTKYNVYRDVIGFVTNIILNWLLIPIWGGKGAALASVIAFLCAFISGIFSRKLRFQVINLSLRSFLFKNLFKIYSK